jgi:hypothetical protein
VKFAKRTKLPKIKQNKTKMPLQIMTTPDAVGKNALWTLLAPKL